jgi:uncharacterized iron-regulated membrane protein
VRLIFQIHKWVGIGIGLVLVMWIITGIMAVGGDAVQGRGRRDTGPDFARATMTPAQAVQAAISADSGIAPVTQLTVERLGAKIVYRLTGAGGAVMLLDAGDGSRVVVDEAVAREVVLLDSPKATIGAPTLIERHDGVYQGGALPVWRVALGNEAGTVVHVNVATGALSRTDRKAQLHRTVMGLHTFGSLRRFIPSARAVYYIFIAASIISLVSVLTGYYLSLPKAWRLGGKSGRS